MTDPDTTHERAERIAKSISERREDGSSRRSFMTRSAVAGSALVGLASATGIGLAQEDGDDQSGDDGAAFDDVGGTDVDVLNYALTLEHLEDAFYEETLGTFSEDDFANADALEHMPEDMSRSAYSYVQTVGEHEAAHVDVLSQAIQLLGGTPVERGSYDFGVETVGDMLELAMTLENTGVGAYQGAAPFVESPDLVNSALSIHSVEARHAAFFNHLLGQSPFPNAFDEALTQQEVLDAAGPLVEDMPDEGGDGGDDGNGGENGDGDDGGNGDGGNGGDGGTGDGGDGGNQTES